VVATLITFRLMTPTKPVVRHVTRPKRSCEI
jgi:hypothetical protein